jgi:hypothetical protein
MITIDRRKFLSGASALGAGLIASCKNESPLHGNLEPGGEEPKHSYKYRVAFNAWINDVRKREIPFENWPLPTLDDETVESNIANFDLLAKTGYNSVDLFGLLATYAWPVDIKSVADKERRRRVNLILDAAHKRGLKVIYGMGVYSWGFDDIIKHDPAIQGDNRHAMCAAKKESWEWQRKVFDYILDEFDIDGFHLEPSDQGRCRDQYCKHWGDVEYYGRITSMCADYVRSKRPQMWLTAILIGWGTWGKDFTDEEKDRLVELSRSVDCMVDQGHRQPYIPQAKRREFIQRLHCDFGTSGGIWVYPPQRWDRSRWFLPYPLRTGAHIRKLYEDGGRGLMYYQGPITNPSAELNTAFGGRIMSDPGRDVEEVLAEVLESLYRPRSTAAHRKLVEIFQRAENLHFDQWPDKEILEYGGHTITPKRKTPPPGEVHLTTLLGVSPGPATYLTEPFLDTEGRIAYKEGLVSVLKDISKIESDFRDEGRIKRIQKCISNVLLDLNNIGMAKNETKVWRDAPQTWDEGA